MNVADDAFGLASEILRKNPYRSGIYKCNLAQEKGDSISEMDFLYRLPETPYFFERKEILEIVGAGGYYYEPYGSIYSNQNYNNERKIHTPFDFSSPMFPSDLKGLIAVNIDLDKLKKWFDTELTKRISKTVRLDANQSENNKTYYVYENQQLKLTLLNGTTKSVDLSKAHVFRPVFESFYNLSNAGVDIYFEKEELLSEYKRITDKSIEWIRFIHIKSSYGNMIKGDPILKKRIMWEYDRNKKKYRFEILPISEGFSDDPK